MSRPRRPEFGPWLVAAAAAHGLLWFIWRVERKTDEVAAHRVSDVVELDLVYEENATNSGSDTRTFPAVGEAVKQATNSAHARKELAPSTRVAAGERIAPSSDGASDGAPDAPWAEEKTPSEEVGERQVATEGTAGSRASASGDPTARLADLGIGRPNAAALRPYLDHQPLALAQDRLDQNLAQAIVDRDRDHSMGVEGPITNALHTGAMATIAPRSLSKIAIIIGRDGKLADFRIIETNRDARGLHALGERVKNLLANQVVRSPSGRPMEFIYELKSEVLLPSGRAPGLGVEVLGLPLKEAEDKSSKLSILTPKLKFESLAVPDPEKNGKITQTPPQIGFSLSILGVDADPVDIGSTGRQVVRTRLIQQRVL